MITILITINTTFIFNFFLSVSFFSVFSVSVCFISFEFSFFSFCSFFVVSSVNSSSFFFSISWLLSIMLFVLLLLELSSDVALLVSLMVFALLVLFVPLFVWFVLGFGLTSDSLDSAYTIFILYIFVLPSSAITLYSIILFPLTKFTVLIIFSQVAFVSDNSAVIVILFLLVLYE